MCPDAASARCWIRAETEQPRRTLAQREAPDGASPDVGWYAHQALGREGAGPSSAEPLVVLDDMYDLAETGYYDSRAMAAAALRQLERSWPTRRRSAMAQQAP